MSKCLYFVAGEASGDAHGAALMTALRQLGPELILTGRGGPRMRAVGGESLIDWSHGSAVLGLWEVIRNYGYFRQQFAATLQEIRDQRADAVVLIDYPGFNLRLARALRAKLPRVKIIYYISPQVWAWNRRRIPQMAKYLDLMLCIFPFEAELYNKSGLRTIFVGHPMMETLNARRVSESRDFQLVGLFPGSRSREVRKILPIMLEAAQRLAAGRPGTHFEVAAVSEMLAEEAVRMLSDSALPANLLRITIGEASATMQRAQAGMVASGTATLEAAFFRMPFVLVYKVAGPTYLAGKILIRIKHLGMPNVLADREIVPEFIQGKAQPAAIAKEMLHLLDNRSRREQMIADFDAVITKLGGGGASETAARAILEAIG